jgi:hypothetical protein
LNGEVFIVSLAPYAVASANRPFGTYLVPAAPKGGYTVYRVKDAIDTRQLGDGQHFPHAIQARALAEDLIRDVREHGVFVSETEKPDPEALAHAKEQSLLYLRKQVENANAEFRQHGNVSLIGEHPKAAAEMLGMKPEWLSKPVDQITCPACQERVSPLVARCTNCRAMLDWEKAREYSLLTPEEERNGILMGKLKPLPEVAPAAPKAPAQKQARG